MLGNGPWAPAERGGRFVEFVTMLDELLRAPEVSLHGDYYRVVEGRTYPGCVQEPRVPFAVAATGLRGMRLAAELGQTWVTTGDLAPTTPCCRCDAGVRVVGAQMASSTRRAGRWGGIRPLWPAWCSRGRDSIRA